jgi:regulator of replication initiation timing
VYDEEKESILSMRNHRTTLQDSAKRLRQQLKETIEKKEMMRMEIIHQRTRTKDHLKRQTLHSELNEAEVVSTKQQLQAIVTENLHICEMAKDLQLECIWMREHQKRPKMDMAEVSRIRENLATQWSNDQKIEEVCYFNQGTVLLPGRMYTFVVWVKLTDTPR